MPTYVQPIQPGPNQESVWDYPRPPACQPSARHVTVTAGDVPIADTHAAYRVLETSHPPTWYLPPGAVDSDLLRRSDTRPTLCEWKGVASYFDIVLPAGDRGADRQGRADLIAVAWCYPSPTPDFAMIENYLAFDPSRLQCWVDGELARPQDGGFYAGWITDDVVGPFKGGPGSLGW